MLILAHWQLNKIIEKGQQSREEGTAEVKQDKTGLRQCNSTSWFPGRKAYGSEVAFPLRCRRRPMVSLQQHMGFH